MKALFLWSQYSPEIKEALRMPLQAGSLRGMEGMRLAEVVVPSKTHPFQLKLSLLVDEEDGVVADAKYQTNGPLLLMALAELVCRFTIRKTYLQVYRFQVETLEALLNLKNHPRLEESMTPLLNIALEALEEASETFFDIPLTEKQPPPSPMDYPVEGSGLPLWNSLTPSEKLEEIRKVLDQEIRPYIELDAGGIEILSLSETDLLKIAYHGACTSCPSSIGATLGAITNILRAKLSPTIEVEPDETFLSF